MQHRVLDTADIVINRQPVIGTLIQHPLCVRRAITGVVPTGLNKGIKSIGFPFCVPPAFRTGSFTPVGICLDRRLNPHESHIFGQHHGQVFIRHRHRAAVGTVNHRYRAAPVALARDPPVTKTVIHLALTDTLRFDMLGNSLKSGVKIQSAEIARIDRDGVFFGRPGCFGDINGFTVRRCHHLNDRQCITAGESMVTFIMRWHSHDRTSAIPHQHKIRHPDGDELPA